MTVVVHDERLLRIACPGPVSRRTRGRYGRSPTRWSRTGALRSRGSIAVQSRRIRSARAGTGSGFQSPATSVPPRITVSPCGNRYTRSAVSSGGPMKKPVMPGLAATTTWPRNAVSAGSGTRSRAPAPVQFTTARTPRSRAAPVSERTVAVSTSPPAFLEPGLEIAEVGRHVHQRRRVTPPAGEPGWQAVPGARGGRAEVAEPVRGRPEWRRFAARRVDAGHDPHAGPGLVGEPPEHGQRAAAPPGAPRAFLDQMRSPDRASDRGCGLGRGHGRLNDGAHPGLGEADRRGEPGHARAHHQHVAVAAWHTPTVARPRLGAGSAGSEIDVAGGRPFLR